MKLGTLFGSIALLGALSLPISGCDVFGPVPVNSVTLSSDSATLRTGEVVQFTAILRNEHKNPLTDRSIAWSSSDSLVAQVDSTGRVTGVGSGVARIVARADGKGDTAHVRVTFPFESVSAGAEHSCGIVSGGHSYCWGTDVQGVQSTRPVPVPQGEVFRLVSTGGYHSCGINSTGQALCWGLNEWGQLGDGSQSTRSVAATVAGDLIFRQVSAGRMHTCGVTSSGAAYCWGLNQHGQLGSDSVPGSCMGTNNVPIDCSTVPVLVEGGHSFASISAGVEHTCGVTTAGEAFCWGFNGEGRLGTSADPVRSTTPVPVSGGLAFVSVSAGHRHTCGLVSGGAAYCWGDNSLGQLGDGSLPWSSEPVPVSGGLSFATLSAGGAHACGVTAVGDAYCWGDNADGQLGNGDISGSSTDPVPVAGGFTLRSVSAGHEHTCGVTLRNVAVCWGANRFGQLGNSSDAARPVSGTPVLVSG